MSAGEVELPELSDNNEFSGRHANNVDVDEKLDKDEDGYSEDDCVPSVYTPGGRGVAAARKTAIALNSMTSELETSKKENEEKGKGKVVKKKKKKSGRGSTSKGSRRKRRKRSVESGDSNLRRRKTSHSKNGLFLNLLSFFFLLLFFLSFLFLFFLFF